MVQGQRARSLVRDRVREVERRVRDDEKDGGEQAEVTSSEDDGGEKLEGESGKVAMFEEDAVEVGGDAVED